MTRKPLRDRVTAAELRTTALPSFWKRKRTAMTDSKRVIYDIINPSDAYTIAPDAFLPGAIGVLLMGLGAYGMKPSRGEGEELPIFLLGGAMEWAKERCGMELEDWLRVPANGLAVAEAIDTVLVGSARDRVELEAAMAAMPDARARADYLAAYIERRRTSMNNIGRAAAALAGSIRAKAEKAMAAEGAV